MTADVLQRAWQSQTSRTRVTVDEEVLSKEVERSQALFRAMIFWRDFREVGISLVMIPLWTYWGVTHSMPWTWYLAVPVSLWIAGFMLVDRFLHNPKAIEPGDSLTASIKESLRQQEHQIWLLRNVFWWYLLPSVIAMTAFFIQVFATALRQSPPEDWGETLIAVGSFLFFFGIVYSVYWFVYALNQKAVRMQLEPRRKELVTMLAGLGESTGIGTGTTASKAVSDSKSRMLWPLILIVGMSVLSTLWIGFAAGFYEAHDEGPAKNEGPQGEDLATLIADLRKESKLVGLAAMVSVDGKMEANAAVGERMIGSGVALDLGDQWHLGSITKSITSTMIGRMIEAGKLQWTETIGQRFPEAGVHDDWKEVTLEQLLTHTSGAPANFGVLVRMKQPAIGPELTRARRQAVFDVLKEKPPGTPGKSFAYSNVGYTIAAAMAEEATGMSWEDLVEREVFEPLKLAEAGFGPPKSPAGTFDQPRGHRGGFLGKTGVSDTADNSLIMAPSGAVHMTLAELSRHGSEHMRGELGTGELLTTETFKRLHTPKLHDYACGWVVRRPTQTIPRTVYWHNGSNTMWYALLVFIPDKNMVVAVASNDGDIRQAEGAAWKVVEWSANRFKTEGDEDVRKRLSGLPPKN